jgi:hypothetical protein
MGQQLSCAIIACYLIKYNNMNAHTAIEYCKKKRQMAFFGQVNFIDTIMKYIQKTIKTIKNYKIYSCKIIYLLCFNKCQIR